MFRKYRLLETAQSDGAAGGGGEGGGDSQQQQAPDTADLEAQARDMGWQPKEQWKGDATNWVDAKEFVRRGQTFIPFLQHDRRRLQSELRQVKDQFGQVQTQLTETQTQLREITEFNRQMAVERDTRRKSELGSSIRSEEDPVRKAEMETELRTITDREQKRTQQPPAERQQQPPQQVQIQPWVQNFLSTNNDFFQNPHKTALFNSVILQKRKDGDTRVGDTDGVALLNEVKTEVETMLGSKQNSRRQAPAKTEDSRPAGGGGGGGGSGGQNFFDMPSEAQAKCNSQESRFVGEGRAFKDQAAWRKHYTAEYFGN